MKTTRLASLDSLKALSILFVILNHSLTGKEINQIGGAFWIYMAVPIFLIISGFNMYRSIEKRKMNKYPDYFNKDYLLPKLRQILIPWLLAIAIIAPYQSFNNHWTLIEIVERYLLRFGFTGGYYIAILLQFYVLFPFLYKSFQKNRLFTTIALVLVQLSFDYLVNMGPLAGVATIDRIYRIAILRYLVFISAGMWLASETEQILRQSWRFYVLALLSILFMVINSYTAMPLPLFAQWTRTSLPTVFYAFALVLLFMKNETYVTNRFLSDLGQRTYSIYIAQMLYFEIEASEFLRHSLAGNLNLPLIVPVAIDVLICVGAGYFFSFVFNRYKSATKVSTS